MKFLEKDKEKEKDVVSGKRPSLPPLPKLEPIKETSMFAKKMPPMPSREMPLFPDISRAVPPPPPPVPRELPSPFVEEIRSVGEARPMVKPAFRARPAPPPLPPFPQPRRISPAEIATVERMEEREVGRERKEIEELKKRAPKKTIFVEINDFKELLEGIGDIREHLGEHEAILDKLVAIKNEEDRHFDKWQAQLTDLQRKLLFVDKTLFETKYV